MNQLPTVTAITTRVQEFVRNKSKWGLGVGVFLFIMATGTVTEIVSEAQRLAALGRPTGSWLVGLPVGPRANALNLFAYNQEYMMVFGYLVAGICIFTRSYRPPIGAKRFWLTLLGGFFSGALGFFAVLNLAAIPMILKHPEKSGTSIALILPELLVSVVVLIIAVVTIRSGFKVPTQQNEKNG